MIPIKKCLVDEIFSEPGKVRLAGDNPRAEIAQFDRPAELTFIRGLVGDWVICRKSDVPFVQKKNAIVLQVLKRHGIEPLKVADLSDDKVETINREIALELQKKLH